MERTVEKQIVRSILALARTEGVQDVLWISKPADAWQQVSAELGAACTDAEQAKACVCLESAPPAWALERKLPIIRVARNGSYRAYLHALLNQDTSPFCGVCLQTQDQLDSEMQALGYAPQRCYDLYGTQPDTDTQAVDALGHYLDWYKAQTDPNALVTWLVRLYTPGSRTPANAGKRPFLSVLTRTQGQREAGLTEVLLCLAAQSDRDFELLIVGHKVKGEALDRVQRLIADTPAYLRERIRYIPCDEDGRAAPLNCGFALARGEYVTVLDDDDIVMDNWVASFHELSRANNGAVLHTYMMKQNWKYIPHAYGSGEDLRACGSMQADYCLPFDMKEQLVVNHCPQGCVAYPARVFQKWGLRFDASLNVTEDWDFMMRAIALCGVADNPVVTSVYRWWVNGKTSATEHSQKEWADTYQKLTQKFAAMPLIISAGDFFTGGNNALANIPAELFAQQDGAFSPETIQVKESKTTGIKRKFVFKGLPSNVYRGLLRLDPCYQGGVVISGLRITVTPAGGGKRIVYGMDDVTSNGWWINNELAFLEEDPQIYFRLPDTVSAETIKVEYTGPLTMSTTYARDIAQAIACTSARLDVKSMHADGPVPAHISCYGNHIHCVYQLKSCGVVQALSFSPCLRGDVIVQHMEIQAEGASGEQVPLRWKHNGICRPHAAIFLRQPVYRARCNRAIQTMTVDFHIDGEISEGAALSLQNPLKYAMKKLLKLLHLR